MSLDQDAVKKHLISVADFHAMDNVGLFPESPKVELINGEIFDMAPIGPAHGSVVKQLTERFVLAASKQAIVSVQDPVRLGDLSEPQPDVCLLRREKDYYASESPKAEDVLLVVEVAQSSLAFDLKVKSRLYASHNIQEYWLVDIPNRQLLVFKELADDSYKQQVTLRSPTVLSPDALPDIEIDMSGLF